MKKLLAIGICLLLCLGCAAIAWGEEESVAPNAAVAALERAEEAAAPAREALEAFLNADEETQEAAVAYGEELAQAIRAARRDETFTLEADANMENAGMLTCNASRTMTIDLNGHILYAPNFGYGNFVLQGGIAADVMGENDNSPLKLTLEEDLVVLRDRNSAALDLSVCGNLTIVNKGLVNGLRRMIYQTAGSNKVNILNSGTIYSNTYGFTNRTFHQNSTVTVNNTGTIVGLIRGFDLHCAGGSLVLSGGGTIAGVAGLDIEIPKVAVDCLIIADDHHLTPEQEQAVTNRLNPYGDKDVPTGYAYDWKNFQGDYWATWDIKGSVWASAGALRLCYPQNERLRGSFAPAIAEDSPSREITCVMELSEAYHQLTGAQGENKLKTAWKNFSMDNFFAAGGEMRLTVYSRYAEADGTVHVRYSLGDSMWSRITGRRVGKNFTWDEAENGTVDCPEPLDALNSYYQLKSALAAAGPGGLLILDQEVTLPEGSDAIALPSGVTVRGLNGSLKGTVRLSVDKSAKLENIDLTETELLVSGTYRSGDVLTLDSGEVGSLRADNVGIVSTGAVGEMVSVIRSGSLEHILPVREVLRVDATDQVISNYRYVVDVGDAEHVGVIDLILERNRLGKTLTFVGTTTAGTIDLVVLDDRNPEISFEYTGTNPEAFYAGFLKAIQIRELSRPDGTKPTLSLRDEKGNLLYLFTWTDGAWKLTETGL